MTAWDEYCHYHCRICHSPCINHASEPFTQARECQKCYRVPDLQRAPPTTASEGEGGATRLRPGGVREEIAPECPEGAIAPTRAERGLALDRAARAPPPTPQGEGVAGTRQPSSQSESSMEG